MRYIDYECTRIQRFSPNRFARIHLDSCSMSPISTPVHWQSTVHEILRNTVRTTTWFTPQHFSRPMKDRKTTLGNVLYKAVVETNDSLREPPSQHLSQHQIISLYHVYRKTFLSCFCPPFLCWLTLAEKELVEGEKKKERKKSGKMLLSHCCWLEFSIPCVDSSPGGSLKYSGATHPR